MVVTREWTPSPRFRGAPDALSDSLRSPHTPGASGPAPSPSTPPVRKLVPERGSVLEIGSPLWMTAKNQVIVHKGGQDEDTELRVTRHQRRAQVEAFRVRAGGQFQIKENDLRPGFPDNCQGRIRCRSLTDHPDVIRPFQDRTQPLSDDGMVVDQHDVDLRSRRREGIGDHGHAHESSRGLGWTTVGSTVGRIGSRMRTSTRTPPKSDPAESD